MKSMKMGREMQRSVKRIIPFKPLMLLCKKISNKFIESNWSPLAVNLIGYALENYLIAAMRGIPKYHAVYGSGMTLVHEVHQSRCICRTSKEVEGSDIKMDCNKKSASR